MKTYTQTDCIESLREADSNVEGSISRREYINMDISPSHQTIKRIVGSWSEAKEIAGLEKCTLGRAIDVNFFEKIDTSVKAYWLGFLWGDGHICKRENNRYTLSLKLQLTDIGHIQKFKRDISSNHTISRYENDNACEVTIGINSFTSHIVDKGLTNEKTTDGSLPSLDREFHPDFIRGLSDADGYHGPHEWRLSSISEARIDKISKWIPFETKIRISDMNRRNRLYQLIKGGGRDEILPFYEWLYPQWENTAPSLDRKLDDVVGYYR